MNKLILAITAGLATYKQERIEAVIDAGTRAVQAHVIAATPARVDLLNTVVSAAVTKTYEDSAPLLAFLQAAQGLVDHYGPAVVPAFQKGVTARVYVRHGGHGI